MSACNKHRCKQTQPVFIGGSRTTPATRYILFRSICPRLAMEMRPPKSPDRSSGYSGTGCTFIRDAAPATNNCTGAVNCVVLYSGSTASTKHSDSTTTVPGTRFEL